MPTLVEFNQKANLSILRSELEWSKADAFVTYDENMIYWATGSRNLKSISIYDPILVIDKEDINLIVPLESDFNQTARDWYNRDNAVDKHRENVNVIKNLDGSFQLGDLFNLKKYKRILIDPKTTTQSQLEEILESMQDHLSHWNKSNIESLISREEFNLSVGYEEKWLTNLFIKKLSHFRMLKSDFEVSLIYKATQITNKALEKVVSKIKGEFSIKKLKAELIYEMRLLGADKEAFEPTIKYYKNDYWGEHLDSKDEYSAQLYNEGWNIIINCGAEYKGYKSDITRTFVLNQSTEALIEKHKIYNLSREKILDYLRTVKVGDVSKNIYVEITKVLSKIDLKLEKLGLMKNPFEGHGIGLELFETNPSKKLEEGMVFTVVAYYSKNSDKFEIEEPIYISKDGAIVLSDVHPNIEKWDKQSWGV